MFLYTVTYSPYCSDAAAISSQTRERPDRLDICRRAHTPAVRYAALFVQLDYRFILARVRAPRR